MAFAPAPARRRRQRIWPARYPYSAELQYYRLLRGIVADLRAAALEELDHTGPLLIAQADLHRPDERDDQTDFGWAALLRDMLGRIASRIGRSILEASARITAIADLIDTTNRQEWRRQVRAAYGVDVTAGEPWLLDQLAAFEESGLALIKSMPEQIVEQLRGIFIQAFREGTSLPELRGIIQDRTGVAESRAALIARTETARMNSSLTERRQRSIGIDSYIWRTMQDERVRRTHRVRDGKTYRWSSGDLKPGTEPNCRCYADPVFPDLAEAEVPLL